MPHPLNAQVAARLDEIAQLLHQQGANPFRTHRYYRAPHADTGAEPAAVPGWQEVVHA